MSTRPLPPELADLVQRVARHPHGLGFLHQAYIDSVAVTLGVHPFVVDAARAYLDTPEGRAALIEEVRLQHERDRSEATSEEAAPPLRIQAEGLGLCRALIGAAGQHPKGVAFLTDGPPEEVAESFDVHPYLVFRARGVIERQRLEREHGPCVCETATRHE